MTIAGCRVEVLSASQCGDFVASLAGATDLGSGLGLRWLLAHGEEGVTWGRRASAGEWQLASTRFPEVAPPVRPETLSTLRLFGPEQEVLVWRTDGELRGRRASDDSDAVPDWLRPRPERRVVLGDRLIERRDGFCRVASATGAEQVLPFDLRQEQFRGRSPLRLVVRHHFESLAESGVVRVALTRLVDLVVEG